MLSAEELASCFCGSARGCSASGSSRTAGGLLSTEEAAARLFGLAAADDLLEAVEERPRAGSSISAAFSREAAMYIVHHGP